MGISLGNLVQRMRSPSSMVDYSEYAPSTMMGYQPSVAPLYQLRGYSPFYVGEGDIYSQIMGQQAAPRTLADYYPGFTGGYDTGLYQRMRNHVADQGSDVSGLLDMGGGMGGDAAAPGGSDYGLGLIGLGQGLSSLGLTGLGSAIGNIGIGQLGAAEADAAAQAAAAESMAAVAADQAAAAADAAAAYGYGVADAVGMSGFGDAAAGYGAADGVGASGFGDAGGFGGDSGGFGGGDSGGGGFGGGGDGGFAKGGKVTMRGLLVDETLPGPDDGYAALQAGEYVIKKSTTKKLGDKKLQALNEGRASIKMRKE